MMNTAERKEMVQARDVAMMYERLGMLVARMIHKMDIRDMTKGKYKARYEMYVTMAKTFVKIEEAFLKYDGDEIYELLLQPHIDHSWELGKNAIVVLRESTIPMYKRMIEDWESENPDKAKEIRELDS